MDSPQKDPTCGRSAAQLRRQQPAWQGLQQDRSHSPTASVRENQQSQSSKPLSKAKLRPLQAELGWNCCCWPQELPLGWSSAGHWRGQSDQGGHGQGTTLGGQGAVPAEPRDVPAYGMVLSTEQEKAEMSGGRVFAFPCHQGCDRAQLAGDG